MMSRNVWYPAAIAALFWASAGCAARSSGGTDAEIRALKAEVARLSSERANLDARAAMLDDKLVLMTARLKKCDGLESRPLPVVKLSPTAEARPEEAVSSVDEPRASDHEVVREGNRPKLVLGSRGRHSAGSGAPSRRREGPLTVPEGFDEMGADNLGVTDGSAPDVAAPAGMAQFNDAYRAYSNKRHDEALRGFAAFIKENPEHPYADDALYWRGESYLAQGKFLFAVGEYQRLVRRYPRSDKAASGLFRIGFAYDKLRDYTKAAEYYFDVVDKFPGTDAARRAGARVAELNNSRSVGSRLVPTSARR